MQSGGTTLVWVTESSLREEKWWRESEGICIVLNSLQCRSKARGEMATKPLSENPREIPPETELSSEGRKNQAR